MDIIIPLGNGSRHNNLELRFTLRSIEKYVECDQIYIVGEIPDFLVNAFHIDCKENRDNRFKDNNIFMKVYHTFKHINEIADDTYFFNDDHIVMQPYKEEYHYKGTLKQTLDSRALGDPYRKVVRNTLSLYPSAKDFDTHAPMLFNKQKFLRTMNVKLWDKMYGYCLKTLYCNNNNIPGSYYPDLKIDDKDLSVEEIQELTAGRKYFSFGERGFSDNMIQFLLKTFPDKSKYEADEIRL